MAPPANVVGIAAFSKKVILYGSDGNVKVYNSTDPRGGIDHDNTNMPKASVHVVDPMCLDSKLVECGCGRAFESGVTLPVRSEPVRRRLRGLQAGKGGTYHDRAVHHRPA